ncbi:MAG: flippase [Candidatus Firestonebacteria bacterium]
MIFTKKIIKNTTWLFVSQVITKILSLLFVVYLGRTLLIADFGRFNLANAFVSIFGIIVDFGFNLFIVREISRNKDKPGEYLGSIIPLKLLLTFVAVVLMYVTAVIMKYDNLTFLVIMLFGVYYFLFSFSMFFRTIFLANEIMEYESVFAVLDKLMVFVLGIAVLLEGKGILWVAGVYSLVEAVILILSIILLFKKFPGIKFSFSFKTLSYSVKQSFIFFLLNILLMVFLYIDSLMLSKMKDETAVGLYNAAYNLVYNLRFLVSPLINAIFPAMSLSAVKSVEELFIMSRKVRKTLFLLGLGISVIGFIFSRQIIILLYGLKFEASVPAFAILITAIPFIYLNGFYGYLLTAVNKQKSILYMLSISCLVNIILNLIFIPKYGFIGASVITLISEILCFVLYYGKMARMGFK